MNTIIFLSGCLLGFQFKDFIIAVIEVSKKIITNAKNNMNEK